MCDICGKVYNNIITFIRHMEYHKENAGKIRDTMETVMEDNSKEAANDLMVNNNIPSMVVDFEGELLNRKIVPPEKNPKIYHCDFWNASKNEESIEKGKYQHQCDKCDKKFKRASDLASHKCKLCL